MIEQVPLPRRIALPRTPGSLSRLACLNSAPQPVKKSGQRHGEDNRF